MGTFFFNYLIGNVDAHGRNFSILAERDASIRLAPSYDLTSANLYYSRGDMAMRFGREYQDGNVMPEDFSIFCQQCTIDERTGHQVYDGLVKGIADNVDVVCAEAKDQCGSDFCDTMREHLKRQLELKGDRFS
jgi:serine/threonine-protein kinase HipA